tara:strand:+ start:578 stop:1942 length:1365 start_codon:yes stop_codon:yes gene_type:complete
MVKLSQQFEQKQKLSPKQILEANIIQLNYSNLEKRITEEIESNPLLEVIEEDNSNVESIEEQNEEEFNWDDLSSNSDEYDSFANPQKKEYIENAPNLDEKNLTEDVLAQLYDLNCKEKDIKIAKNILGNLNERGYLTVDAILIADKLQVEEIEVKEVIAIIQHLDPPGIASSSMKDCILVQLEKYYPDDLLSLNIITNYFDDFVNKRYSKIKDKLNCNDSELSKVAQKISVLNPNPAVNYCTAITEHIKPDIFVEKIEGKWEVVLNEPHLGNLGINKYYSELANKKQKDKEVSSFLKNKIKSATWFIDAINQRNKTIRKVVKSIISFQNLYFNDDDRKLSPMILKDIADDIDMDVSTISRVTNGKYMQLPWGTKELKSFFTEGVKKKNGEIVSNTILKKDLQKLINKEDKKNPYTDEDLMKLLIENDYDIARRTVTKYRELLKIPQSRLRKELI